MQHSYDSMKDKKPYSKKSVIPPFERREFIKALGLAAGSFAAGFTPPRSAGPKEFSQIQTEKIFDTQWIQSLYERGSEEVYTGEELTYIGMPVGGITAGQVYLGGDGKLWLWKIFNKQHNGVVEKVTHLDGRRIRSRDGSNYVIPIMQDSPFEQGFKVKIRQQETKYERYLDARGFKDISFKGQYPLAEVKYRDKALPIEIDLTAFSPFIPLDWDSSSFPATVMRYKLSNTSTSEVSVSLQGWIENPVHLNTGDASKTILRNRLVNNQKSANVILDAPEALAKNINSANDPTQQTDFGSMALLLRNIDDQDRYCLQNNKWTNIQEQGQQEIKSEAKARPVAGLEKVVHLAPGEEKVVEFIISWYFPNLHPSEGWRDFSSDFQGRHYKSRFADANEVAMALDSRFDELFETTTLWNKTFYQESTLPFWFLNRTFVNLSTLATETCYRLEDGRFWAWEGVGCCPGTCTHVWHYAQGMGRIFPEIERNLREQTDFQVMDQSTGKIDFRAGIANRDAADGQAGLIMRAYRDHQMSADDSYLERNWNYIKLALQYLIDMDQEDGKADGMIFGEQHNTLDAEWYGNIPVITSLYLCALSCGVEMAKHVGDKDFEQKCETILTEGQKNIEALFNQEYKYFVQNEDPNHEDAIGIGPGCYIDQVFGQSWAFQVGLGRLYNEQMIKDSLKALWEHNFVQDMGKYRASLPENLAGRPYALDGESGLIMCTWPNGGRKQDWERHWQYGYFNECMSGFEYQAASHMMWEGGDLIDKSMIITRAIHDRYSPLKRNPFNEIECSDHYARALASYGVYLAACGFEYNGPKGYMAFNPRFQQDNFKAAFVGAEGWGTFSQLVDGKTQTNKLVINYGTLEIEQLTLTPDINNLTKVSLVLNNKKLRSKWTEHQGRYTIISKFLLEKGDEISVVFS